MPDKYSSRDDDYISQVSNPRPPSHSELVSLDDGKVSNKQDTAPSLSPSSGLGWLPSPGGVSRKFAVTGTECSAPGEKRRRGAETRLL